MEGNTGRHVARIGKTRTAYKILTEKS
jgi:hypothetical protein